MSNSEIIEWLKKKAETVTMPGARKMYQAAVKALEAQKDMVSRKTANVAICNACGKIDCDQADKCERLQLPPANCSEFPNSSDTISRAKAIEALDKRFDSIPMEQTSEILMLRKDLRELPPAQPERIVHCKDCEWWTKQECSPQGRCALSGMYPTGGWFCGNARMREVTT